MKHVLLKISVVLATFSLGLTAEMVSRNYIEFSTDAAITDIPQQHQQLELVSPRQQTRTELGPDKLRVELQRIDEMYGRRCQFPTDLYGEWETVKQLDRFRTCNDEWAEARREAITTELDSYLVHY